MHNSINCIFANSVTKIAQALALPNDNWHGL